MTPASSMNAQNRWIMILPTCRSDRDSEQASLKKLDHARPVLRNRKSVTLGRPFLDRDTGLANGRAVYDYCQRSCGQPCSIRRAQHELTRKRLQTLLGERFNLALRRAVNPATGYVLTVEKNGHKMIVGNDPGGLLRQMGRWEIYAERVKISTFTRFLGVHLHGTVEDRTGLEGGYTFHLRGNPELREGQSVRSFDGQPDDSLIPAVREQLGLRLEQQKVATDRYTIERAEEKPTEN